MGPYGLVTLLTVLQLPMQDVRVDDVQIQNTSACLTNLLFVIVAALSLLHLLINVKDCIDFGMTCTVIFSCLLYNVCRNPLMRGRSTQDLDSLQTGTAARDRKLAPHSPYLSLTLSFATKNGLVRMVMRGGHTDCRQQPQMRK